MVRTSLGVYTNTQDVDRLLAALHWLVANRDRLKREYYVTRDGRALRHDGWHVDPDDYNPYPHVRPGGLFI